MLYLNSYNILGYIQSGARDLYLFILSSLEIISDSDITNNSLSYWADWLRRVENGVSGS